MTKDILISVAKDIWRNLTKDIKKEHDRIYLVEQIFLKNTSFSFTYFHMNDSVHAQLSMLRLIIVDDARMIYKSTR